MLILRAIGLGLLAAILFFLILGTISFLTVFISWIISGIKNEPPSKTLDRSVLNNTDVKGSK